MATAALMLVAVVLVSMPFQWNGNEENYLLLAYRWWAPATASPLDAVADAGASGGKFLVFALLGASVSLLGFEGARLALFALLAALLAWSLARLARAFGLTPWQAATAVALFCLCRQTTMGGEWFLVSVEAKTFAYAFAMLGLADALELRPLRATLWSLLSFYCLFLIGAFWFAVAAAAYALASGRWRTGAAMGAAFATAAAPLLTVLAGLQRRFATLRPPPGLPDADAIYAALRLPHHLSPFAPVGGWTDKVPVGLAVAAATAGIAWWARRRAAEPRERAAATIVLALAAYPLLAVGLSWIDRDAHRLGKLYLFRPLSLSLLLALFVAVRLWSRHAPGRRWSWRVPAALALAAFAALALRGSLSRQSPTPPRTMDAMVAAVRERVDAREAVLLDPSLDRTYSLERRLRRPTVVNWKFVPTDPADLYRWADLLARRRRAFAGDCSAIPTGVGAMVLLAEHMAGAACGRIGWTDGHLVLVTLRPRGRP